MAGPRRGARVTVEGMTQPEPPRDATPTRGEALLDAVAAVRARVRRAGRLAVVEQAHGGAPRADVLSVVERQLLDSPHAPRAAG